MDSVEKILTDLVGLLPEANFSNGSTAVVQFGWGSQLDLNKHLLAKGKLRKYPLIWLENGKQTENRKTSEIQRRCRFIIAMNSEKLTNLNPLIWETDFEVTLEPIKENLLTALTNSGKTLLDEANIEVQRYPNFSNEGTNKTKAIDVWNAIAIDCDVNFIQNSCFQTLFFNN